MNKKEIINQTKIAFDYVQKLYLEVSYFIKETEGLLAEEEERFFLGRPSGYGINTRGSTGLETNNVYLWLMRNISVFFIPEDLTYLTGGTTNSKFNNNLKVIHLRTVLNEKDLIEPKVYVSVLHNFNKKTPKDKWPTKFEQLMGHIEYQEAKVFSDPSNIHFEDSRIEFRGQYFSKNLFDVNSSEDIEKIIISPVLRIFREL